MIQKFNQFINESASGAQNPLSIYDAINTPFTKFAERAQERLDLFLGQIANLLDDMDKAIEKVMTEFEPIIVGEPRFDVDSDLEEVTVYIDTNVPNNEETWHTDESPAQDLEHRLYDTLKNFERVKDEIFYKPNEDGNCVIRLRSYIIDSDNFGDFTDALIKMGEDY
jgi:hypothetical protein